MWMLMDDVFREQASQSKGSSRHHEEESLDYDPAVQDALQTLHKNLQDEDSDSDLDDIDDDDFLQAFRAQRLAGE